MESDVYLSIIFDNHREVVSDWKGLHSNICNLLCHPFLRSRSKKFHSAKVSKFQECAAGRKNACSAWLVSQRLSHRTFPQADLYNEGHSPSRPIRAWFKRAKRRPPHKQTSNCRWTCNTNLMQMENTWSSDACCKILAESRWTSHEKPYLQLLVFNGPGLQAHGLDGVPKKIKKHNKLIRSLETSELLFRR